MQGSTKGCLPLKDVFRQRWSSNKGGLPTKGHFPLKVVFHQRLSSTEGCLPPKVVFIKVLLSLKVVFHQRSSSTKGRLPPKVVFHQRLSSTYHNTLIHYLREQSTYQVSASYLAQKLSLHQRSSNRRSSSTKDDDLTFVRTVYISNLSLLPCLKVA